MMVQTQARGAMTLERPPTRGLIDLHQALKLPHLVRTGQFHIRRRVEERSGKSVLPVDPYRETMCN